MKFILPLLVILTAVIGSIANININADGWYEELVKSPLNPPGYVFGIVWPILYLLMGIVSFLAAEKNLEVIYNPISPKCCLVLDIFLLPATNNSTLGYCSIDVG